MTRPRSPDHGPSSPKTSRQCLPSADGQVTVSGWGGGGKFSTQRRSPFQLSDELKADPSSAHPQPAGETGLALDLSRGPAGQARRPLGLPTVTRWSRCGRLLRENSASDRARNRVIPRNYKSCGPDEAGGMKLGLRVGQSTVSSVSRRTVSPSSARSLRGGSVTVDVTGYMAMCPLKYYYAATIFIMSLLLISAKASTLFYTIVATMLRSRWRSRGGSAIILEA